MSLPERPTSNVNRMSVTPRRVFAPGCALTLYKPELVDRLWRFLRAHHGATELLRTCCRHEPQVHAGTQVINVCPGCDRRFREQRGGTSTISLWELLADSDTWPFPDYGRAEMTIIDACPTRDQDRVHDAVRRLAARMHITLVEPARTRRRSTCCGDRSHGKVPTADVLARMRNKAAQLPRPDVLVYCVSCAKSMFNGGRSPHYLVDLLCSERTLPGVDHPDHWHRQLDRFIHGPAKAGTAAVVRPTEAGAITRSTESQSGALLHPISPETAGTRPTERLSTQPFCMISPETAQ